MISYRILYALGITPWEDMAGLPVSGQITELFAREEAGREKPFGAALDLGCGSGTWSVELARRGWDVTGVDLVPKAVRAARKRAEKAGLRIRFVQGDLTRLEESGIGNGYSLLLDFGMLHGLRPDQQEAVARGVDAAAAPGATLLMLAFRPGRRGPLPQGMSRAEIEAVYRGWTVTDEIPHDLTGTPGFIRKAAPSWYRLRRG